MFMNRKRQLFQEGDLIWLWNKKKKSKSKFCVTECILYEELNLLQKKSHWMSQRSDKDLNFNWSNQTKRMKMHLFTLHNNPEININITLKNLALYIFNVTDYFLYTFPVKDFDYGISICFTVNNLNELHHTTSMV